LSMKINLGGLCGSFPVADRSFERKLLKRYRHFMAGGETDFKIRTVAAKMKQKPFRPEITTEKNFITLKRGDFRCLFDSVRRKGVLFISPSIQGFDSFLRAFYSRALLREGGMLLHCAGLVKDRKAYLFLGRSGAGKSTLSKIAAAAGADVISDELNLVRLEKGRFKAYGSPFWGEMRNKGRQGAWPLGGVFLLEKAHRNRISPCSKPAALRLLLRCLMNFSRSSEDAALIMKNSARLLAEAGFARLEFTKKNSGFLELVG